MFVRLTENNDDRTEFYMNINRIIRFYRLPQHAFTTLICDNRTIEVNEYPDDINIMIWDNFRYKAEIEKGES